MKAIPLLLLALSAHSATVAEPMREMIDKHEIPGAITVVVNEKKVTHLEVIGHADPDRKVPLPTDAIFWIASMTKPIAGTVVLVDAGGGQVVDWRSRVLVLSLQISKPRAGSP